MAREIAALLRVAPRRKAMGRAGRMRVTRYFSWPNTARNTVRVYERVLAEWGAA